MNTAFIVAYFGRFPNYFRLFLASCRNNPTFDWIIVTDNTEEYDYPQNVKKIKMSFETCRNLIQSKFDFKIALNSYTKLCDFKPAYGYIFEEYLRKYDFWGHCDLDQIFGNLSDFYTEKMFNQYDKIGSLGHLTLYRNDTTVNRIFMRVSNGQEYCREVFSHDKGYAFDEWLPGNVNEIFLNSGRSILLDNYGADVYSYRTPFSLVYFSEPSRSYYFDDVNNSVFKYDKAELYWIYENDSKLIYEKKPYVHLQKRSMNIEGCLSQDSFYIIPNRFVSSSNDPQKLLKKCRKWHLINYQYVKVKYKSLKERIKSHNWQQERIQFKDS